MFGVSQTVIVIAIAAGIGLGSVYALMALSFSVVVATTELFHFTLGSFIMLGTVVSYTLAVSMHWHLYVALPVIVVGGALLGVASYYVAIKPLFTRARHPHSAVLVSTLALSLVIDGLTSVRFGTDEHPVPAYISARPLFLGHAPIRPVFIVMLGVLVVFVTIFELVMHRTGLGRILRASQEDPTAVELSGVRLATVHVGVCAFAGALAALAGFLVAPISYASPFVGATLLLYGFAAMAIGGFGSFVGSVVGGLLVGLVPNLIPVFFAASLTRPALLSLLIVVLLVRPSGLLGRGATREV